MRIGSAGSLPDSWSEMARLVDLYLGDNLLDGELPSEWSAMTQIVGIGLNGNHFTGPLPSRMGWP